MTDIKKKISLNEVKLRYTKCKWWSKRKTKPKVQNLWNDLNESYTFNIFLIYSPKTVVSCPIINLCFEFIERHLMFLSLVEDPTISEQEKEDSLSRDKQCNLVFFLMHNCFLSFQVFQHNRRYYSSFQVTLKF